MNSVFNKLRKSGGYSVPYLLHLYNGTTDYYFINDRYSLEYDGHTWIASAFNYTPQAASSGADGGGTLEIEVVDNLLIEMLESSSTLFCEAVGVLMQDGSVQEIQGHTHKYGTATWNEQKLTISYESDDRLEMTFPSLIFSTYNNRGNA